MHHNRIAIAAAMVGAAMASSALAIDGAGTLQIIPRNGWKAVEVITQGNDPAGDSITYGMPSTFDGIGAWLPSANVLRLEINHETTDASVSEVNLNLTSLKSVVSNMITTGNTGGVSFVTSAQQAYGRWSADGGASWNTTTNNSTTSFTRFCSGQYWKPNTFGTNRGFVDSIYMNGEETAGGRVMAIDLANRDFYQLSGTPGSAPGGLGGFPSDSWENAALLDTGETSHVALLLSPDGGTQNMKIYIGEKGKDKNGNASSSFLARNGLAYGSYYYLKDTLPGSAGSVSSDGKFDTSTTGALNATKFEDIDTNPNNGTQVALGNQNFGLFTFSFNLNFAGGNFNAAGSGFSITKVADPVSGANVLGETDNVDWTEATTINGVTYSNGLILVNEDNGTGEIWMMAPDGSHKVLIADTNGLSTADESTGVLDISALLGYLPGSIILTNDQGSTSSMTMLISPNATLVPEPTGAGMLACGAGVLLRRRRR